MVAHNLFSEAAGHVTHQWWCFSKHDRCVHTFMSVCAHSSHTCLALWNCSFCKQPLFFQDCRIYFSILVGVYSARFCPNSNVPSMTPDAFRIPCGRHRVVRAFGWSVSADLVSLQVLNIRVSARVSALPWYMCSQKILHSAKSPTRNIQAWGNNSVQTTHSNCALL